MINALGLETAREEEEEEAAIYTVVASPHLDQSLGSPTSGHLTSEDSRIMDASEEETSDEDDEDVVEKTEQVNLSRSSSRSFSAAQHTRKLFLFNGMFRW